MGIISSSLNKEMRGIFMKVDQFEISLTNAQYSPEDANDIIRIVALSDGKIVDIRTYNFEDTTIQDIDDDLTEHFSFEPHIVHDIYEEYATLIQDIELDPYHESALIEVQLKYDLE